MKKYTYEKGDIFVVKEGNYYTVILKEHKKNYETSHDKYPKGEYLTAQWRRLKFDDIDFANFRKEYGLELVEGYTGVEDKVYFTNTIKTKKSFTLCQYISDNAKKMGYLYPVIVKGFDDETLKDVLDNTPLDDTVANNSAADYAGEDDMIVEYLYRKQVIETIEKHREKYAQEGNSLAEVACSVLKADIEKLYVTEQEID